MKGLFVFFFYISVFRVNVIFLFIFFPMYECCQALWKKRGKETAPKKMMSVPPLPLAGNSIFDLSHHTWIVNACEVLLSLCLFYCDKLVCPSRLSHLPQCKRQMCQQYYNI